MKEKKKIIFRIKERKIKLHRINFINYIDYKIYNPGGNKTALVIDKEYSKTIKNNINNYILKKHKDIEQVGFIKNNEFNLEMAGGEFCVNATRAAIYYYLKGMDGKLEIKVSGISKKIIGGVYNNISYAVVPINKEINKIIEDKYNYKIVNLEGISLVVLDEKNSLKYLRLDEEKIKKRCKELLISLNLNNYAEGIILQNKNKIIPIIWVRSIDTLYLETACGSGSLATAIIKNTENKKNEFSILQPSGSCLKIELKIENNILISAKVSGRMGE